MRRSAIDYKGTLERERRNESVCCLFKGSELSVFGKEESQEDERPNYVKIMQDINAKLTANREEQDRAKEEKQRIQDRAVAILVQAGLSLRTVKRLQAEAF